MDLSKLHDALASRCYDKIADICDELRIQVASTGVSYHEEWPYAIHLLGHLYISDLNSARFLWKSIPEEMKKTEKLLEAAAAWKIGQCLWTKDYSGVYSAVKEFNWTQESLGIVTSFLENYTKKMFELLTVAYSTIAVSDVAQFLGMTEDDATKYVIERGWILDSESKTLMVVKQKKVTEQKIDPTRLQRLTEFVFQLEN